MKRFKDLLLGLFIFGSIVIVLFIVLSFFNTKKYIEIEIDENTESKLIALKEKVSVLEDGECKVILNDYISKTEDGRFEGITKLSDLREYYMKFPIINYIGEVKDKCNITDEEIDEHALELKYLSFVVSSDVLFEKYAYSYELNLKDKIRQVEEPYYENVLYSSIRKSQIEILNDYVKIINSREVAYE